MKDISIPLLAISAIMGGIAFIVMMILITVQLLEGTEAALRVLRMMIQ